MIGFLRRASAANQIDLEAWEQGLRSAVLRAGANLLENLLAGIGCGRRRQSVHCECGTAMHSKGVKAKQLLTILGTVRFRRSMFQCSVCGKTRYPGDAELDVVRTSRSPGLRRMMARAGCHSTFKEAAEDLQVYADVEVSPKDVERVAEGIGKEIETWSDEQADELLDENRPLPFHKDIPVLYVSYDGTGVPMTPTEVAGRKGKQADGSAKTREAKLGCVFSQTNTDENGSPIRDPDSTTFVGKIECADQFGWRIYAEAVRRGLESAQQVVIIGDGAEWIRGVAEMHFPGAIQIVDLYHARQHLSRLCKILFPGDQEMIAIYRTRWWDMLDTGMVQNIVREATKLLPPDQDSRKIAKTEINYLKKNKKRMRYAYFQERGFFVGSGVIESGCKHVIGKRLKQSGMEWSLRGANAIISLRCATLSKRIEDFWESRAA